MTASQRELLHGCDFAVRVDRELLRVDLEVIALDEDRPAEALAQRGGEHHGDVLRRALIGVPDLGSRDLEQERAGVELDGRAENRARGVVRRAAHVDRRDGEALHRALAARHVEAVYRRGPDTNGFADLPDQPARVVSRLTGPEDRLADERIHFRECEIRLSHHGDSIIFYADGVAKGRGSRLHLLRHVPPRKEGLLSSLSWGKLNGR